MTRVKRGTTSVKTRRNVLKQTKGFRFGRGSKERLANEALVHAGAHAFAHRKDKKSDFRRLWQVRISAGLGEGMSYSTFIGTLLKKNIRLNRKVLSTLAERNPESFARIAEEVTK